MKLLWILIFFYVVAAGVIVMILIADGKPIIMSILAGIFWLPLLIYDWLILRS